MNLVGKILIVVILVMSLVFMTMSLMVYATHHNWQAKATQLQTTLDQERTQRQQLVDTKTRVETTLASEQAARAQQVAKLETEKAAIQAERDQLLKEEAQLKQDLREAVASVQAAQAMLDSKLKEVEQLRTDINDQIRERNEQFAQVVQKTDELNQATNELTRLKDTNVRLSQQMAHAKLVLERNNLRLESPVDGVPPPVDGIVLASSPNGLVELSLGSDDGLERGHKLVVFRRSAAGSTYLGQVEVVTTQPDRAVARILQESRRGNIERDDRVATRIQ